MSILNGQFLLEQQPIVDMLTTKYRENGVSHGLAEAGYDIRVKQDIMFKRDIDGNPRVTVMDDSNIETKPGFFTIVSSIEQFDMPTNLVGYVKDKSTWARRGLSVFNTVIEPGWNGWLTIEMVYYGTEPLHIPAGAGIAQVLFHQTAMDGQYEGKYQGQGNRPYAAISD